MLKQNEMKQPRVVVVGAGFGGLRAARALRNANVQVTLVDRNNYHLFQPLLYQVATAGVSPNEIAYPVRAIFRKQKNLQFQLAEVQRVDLAQRVLETSTGPIPYDALILAPGGETNFFGLQSLQDNAIGLKGLGDAITIRNHLLTLFERAAAAENPDEARALLTFVLVGGGPTGVEMSGSLAELIHLMRERDFAQQALPAVRVLLIEAADHLLPGMPADLAEHTVEVLRKRGVEVCLNSSVESFDGQVVRLKGGETIATRTVIWAAGVKASALLQSLGVPLARQGRVPVEDTLQLAGHPEVFVIGDAAYREEDGAPLPMVAPVAMQQAETAARNVERLLQGEALVPFDYRDPGTLATIGRNQAVARVGRFKFSGFVAWVVWLVVHLIQLIGFRNRLFVLINWAWDYLLYDRPMRLIVPQERK